MEMIETGQGDVIKVLQKWKRDGYFCTPEFVAQRIGICRSTASILLKKLMSQKMLEFVYVADLTSSSPNMRRIVGYRLKSKRKREYGNL
jgi:hypothetical protein